MTTYVTDDTVKVYFRIFQKKKNDIKDMRPSQLSSLWQ